MKILIKLEYVDRTFLNQFCARKSSHKPIGGNKRFNRNTVNVVANAIFESIMLG